MFEDLRMGYGSSWIEHQNFSAIPNIIHNSFWVPIELYINLFNVIHTLPSNLPSTPFIFLWCSTRDDTVVGRSARVEVKRRRRPRLHCPANSHRLCREFYITFHFSSNK